MMPFGKLVIHVNIVIFVVAFGSGMIVAGATRIVPTVRLSAAISRRGEPTLADSEDSLLTTFIGSLGKWIGRTLSGWSEVELAS
jgi:hypothetical protein